MGGAKMGDHQPAIAAINIFVVNSVIVIALARH